MFLSHFIFIFLFFFFFRPILNLLVHSLEGIGGSISMLMKICSKGVLLGYSLLKRTKIFSICLEDTF